jgi:hypothetical protein
MQTLNPVGRLFGDSWRLYKERLLSFIGILIIPFVIVGAGELMIAHGSPINIIGGILIFLGLIISIAAIAAVMISIARGTGVGESYRSGWAIFWPMLWLGILVELVGMGGMVMLVIPLIMMAVWFLFSGYALVVEGKRGIGAISQSREYTRGYWWSLFGRYLLIMIPTMVIYLAIYLPAIFIFGATVGPIISLVLEFIFLPFLLSYVYAMYQNIAAIKPTLATTQSRSSRGFLITSAIVGLLAPIITIIFLIVLLSLSPSLLLNFEKGLNNIPNQNAIQSTASTSTAQLTADLQDPSSWPRTFLGVAGTQISHLSVGLPPGYGIRYLDASTAFIKMSPLYPFGVQVAITPGTLSTEIAAAKSILSQVATAQNPLVITTSTLAGFPATSLEVVGGNAPAYILTPTKTSTGPGVIVVSKQYDNAEFGDQSMKPLEHKIIDDIAASLQFSATGNTSTLMPNAIGTLPSTTMTFGPAANNIYYMGSTYPITWTTPDWANGQIVEINLWRGNSPCATDNETGVINCGVWVGLLHGSNKFNGSYSWQLQNFFIPSNDYRISVSFNDVEGAQSEPFSIAAATSPQTTSASGINAAMQPSGTVVEDMPSLGLEMTVPSDLELTSVVGARGTEADVSFSSQALIQLAATGNLNPSYCADPAASPLGIVMKPEGNNEPLTAPFITKNVNGTNIYLFSTETAEQTCSQDKTAQDLILKQSAELRAAFQTIRAD